jgi:hypothetical protein
MVLPFLGSLGPQATLGFGRLVVGDAVQTHHGRGYQKTVLQGDGLAETAGFQGPGLAAR